MVAIHGTETNTRGVVVLTAVDAVLTLGYDLDKDSDSDAAFVRSSRVRRVNGKSP
jgi:hypothetical protein